MKDLMQAMADVGMIVVGIDEDGAFEVKGSFRVGQCIQAHPATDTWMWGDRFGTVVKVGTKLVHAPDVGLPLRVRRCAA